ncbi:MAG TPA: DUF1840 domain-containing protein [Herbaspirillum sp.]|jgi:hypothetical protein|nr:DUF1840 domain-containing protein [Herbaspirillum sp.]
MLVTFKSKAAADVLMYAAHAKPILDLLHKDIERGIITAAESGAAIALLEEQIDLSKAHEAALEHDDHAHQHGDGDDAAHDKTGVVTFSARVYPLLDMLRRARKGNCDILWGV